MTAHTRICAAAGCKALAFGGPLCHACAALKAARRSAHLAAFDARRARDPHRRIYKTAKWKRLRAAFLTDNPYCAECRASLSTP